MGGATGFYEGTVRAIGVFEGDMWLWGFVATCGRVLGLYGGYRGIWFSRGLWGYRGDMGL